MTATMTRTTLHTSRLLDFFSEKELTAQTGHAPDAWPLVVLKELVDNALDACEDAQVAPQIQVKVNRTGITVADNGPGLPAETVAGVLDYSIRVSSREAYVAPDRGAQGNALKCIVAMPMVLDGTCGKVTISGRGIRHKLTLRVDPIRQRPEINHKPKPDRSCQAGTTVCLHWPNSACSILKGAKARFLQIAEDYAFLNPHLSLDMNWFGEQSHITASNPVWKKWRPSDPTCPHWYTPEHFERLIAGYIAHDADRGEDRTVRKFIAEFAGLTSTIKQKAVLKATGLARTDLSALAGGDGLKKDLVASLLDAMKSGTKPVKPAALGVIGKNHLAERFRELGCKMESFQYRKRITATDDLPSVMETAFAPCPQARTRRLVTGVNWSPGILNPFRELGSMGQSLDALLEQQRAGHDEPVVFLLHLACPRVAYTDRGKSAVVIAE